MKKNILNKVSTFGVVAAVATLAVLVNPLKSLDLNQVFGYWYGYGYGSSPNSSNFTIKEDCRVNGNCDKKDDSKTDSKKDNKPEVGKMVEKEINGKKYSYMNGSNVLITRILADISGYQTKFNDIAASTAKEDIMRLEKAGIVKGTTPTTYEPNRAITRAEFLAIAMGAFGYDLYAPAKSLPFTDVDSSSWQARVISAALENNVIYGDTNASGARVFRPNSQITKVEALAIVYKLSGIELKDAKMHSFTDASAAWQNALLSNAEHLEVISVPTDKKFNPNAGISRADMATLMVKFARLY